MKATMDQLLSWARRMSLREGCEMYGHVWKMSGAPAGTKVCRVCCRWESV